MQYQRDDELGGGFKYFLFSPLFGEDSHFDQYFSNGLKPPTSEVGDEKDPCQQKEHTEYTWYFDDKSV